MGSSSDAPPLLSPGHHAPDFHSRRLHAPPDVAPPDKQRRSPPPTARAKAIPPGHSPDGRTLDDAALDDAASAASHRVTKRIPVDEMWSLMNALKAGEDGKPYAMAWANAVLANKDLIPANVRNEAVMLANAIQAGTMGGKNGAENALRFINNPNNKWFVDSVMSQATSRLVIAVRDLHLSEAKLTHDEDEVKIAKAAVQRTADLMAEDQARLDAAKEKRSQNDADIFNMHLNWDKDLHHYAKESLDRNQKQVDADKGEIKANKASVAASFFPTPLAAARK